MSDPNHSGSRYASLAGVGTAALFVICCAAAPAIVGFAAGLGVVAALLGAGAAVLAAVALAGGTVIAVRARRRRACQPTSGKK